MRWIGVALAFALAAVGVVSAAPAGAGAATAGVPAEPERQAPDVIVIMTDDQRRGTEAAMPYTSSFFGSQGVRYTQAHVPTNVCCPARASFLTGEYSHTTGVWENSGPFGGFKRFKKWDGPTLPINLQRAGYDTALYGKYINHFNRAGGRGSIPRGWDTFHTYDDPDRDGGYWTPIAGLPRGYTTDVLGTAVAGHIAKADPDRPMFVMASLFAPHADYDAGPYRSAAGRALLERFRDAGQLGNPSTNEADLSDKPRWMRKVHRNRPSTLRKVADRQSRTLMGVDANVQRIIAAQAAYRDLANTVVVYLSDNGVAWGDHRLRLKRHPYAMASGIPLMIKYPAGENRGGVPGTVTPRLTNQLDVTATILQLAGARAAGSGRSLLGPVRTTLPVEGSASRGGMLDRPGFCGVRTPRYLWLHYTNNVTELYDYAKDPYELRNVAGDPAYRNAAFRLELSLDPGCDLDEIRALPGRHDGDD